MDIDKETYMWCLVNKENDFADRNTLGGYNDFSFHS